MVFSGFLRKLTVDGGNGLSLENIAFSRVFSLPKCLFDHNFDHNSVSLCSYKKRESFLYLPYPFHDSLLHPGRCFVLHCVEDVRVCIQRKRDGVMAQRF